MSQASSAYFARESLEMIRRTLSRVIGKPATVYHQYIPSFGDRGFVGYRKGGEFVLDPELVKSAGIQLMFDDEYQFRLSGEINTIDRPLLLHEYLKGKERWRL